MTTGEARELNCDWVLVDRTTGMIVRGLTREAIAWMVDASVEEIRESLAAQMVHESEEKLVVGEWRRK